jgi:AAA+ ATPase superfamily predicted ATPase
VHEARGSGRLATIEGLEGMPARAQKKLFMDRVSELSGRPELRTIRGDWVTLLRLLSEHLGRRETWLLLDEFQWLAAGRTALVGALKYAWDNYLCKRNRVHLVICGSVGSFLVRNVLRSRALYGRIDLELPLMPLALPEIERVFRPRRSLREVVELYMCLGGIPQYLEMVDPSESVRGNLERLCFSAGGYLVGEFDRIFVSHFGNNPHYRRILEELARRRFASRGTLQKLCAIDSGGRLSKYLEELELAGFIEGYTPVHKPEAQRLVRYRIADPYLVFYLRFIRPSLRRIRQLRGHGNFHQFVSDRDYASWRGIAFERICHQHHSLLAERLGFGAVRYTCGPWFSRTEIHGAAQIDLLFIRADGVITLCELKYQEAPVGKGVIAEVEQKIARLPNPRGLTMERVLITASDPTRELARERYFHRILRLEDLFRAT